jgi:hypothetical protein
LKRWVDYGEELIIEMTSSKSCPQCHRKDLIELARVIGREADESFFEDLDRARLAIGEEQNRVRIRRVA